jgi:hypothetical protein
MPPRALPFLLIFQESPRTKLCSSQKPMPSCTLLLCLPMLRTMMLRIMESYV